MDNYLSSSPLQEGNMINAYSANIDDSTNFLPTEVTTENEITTTLPTPEPQNSGENEYFVQIDLNNYDNDGPQGVNYPEISNLTQESGETYYDDTFPPYLISNANTDSDPQFPATQIEDVFNNNNNNYINNLDYHNNLNSQPVLSDKREENNESPIARKLHQVSSTSKKRDRYENLWDKDSLLQTNFLSLSKNPGFAMFWVFARTGRQLTYNQLVVPFPLKIGKSRRCTICFPTYQNLPHNFRVAVNIRQINHFESQMNVTLALSGKHDERNANHLHQLHLHSHKCLSFSSNLGLSDIYKFPDVFPELLNDAMDQNFNDNLNNFEFNNTNELLDDFFLYENFENNNHNNFNNNFNNNNNNNNNNNYNNINNHFDNENLLLNLLEDEIFLGGFDQEVSYAPQFNPTFDLTNRIIANGNDVSYRFVEFFIHPLGRGDNKRNGAKNNSNTSPQNDQSELKKKERKRGIKYPDFEITVDLIDNESNEGLGGWKWVFSLIRKKFESEDDANKARVTTYQQYYTRAAIPKDAVPPLKKRKVKPVK